jgi:hypothetical protein
VTLAAVGAALAAPSVLVAAAADEAFEDPANDQRNTEGLVAPDITGVNVSNTRDGLITFRVTMANTQTLPPGSAVVFLFDLDREIATGDQGFENAVSHVVDLAGQSRLVFERWEESIFRLVEIPASSLTSTVGGGVYTLTIPRRELANTRGFEFGLYAVLFDQDGDDHAVDDAPNANLFDYDLTNLPAPRLLTSRLSVVPVRPVAGRSFVVGTQIRRSDTGMAVTTGTVSCNVRVGSTRLRARGSFGPRGARCTMTVPASAKGKRLSGSVTVRAAGAVVTRRFSFRVA